MSTAAVTQTGQAATVTVTVARGLPGSDASVTNSNVNTAIGTDPSATRTSLGLGNAATLTVDADLATFTLPASTTISTFGASLVDDTDASAARTSLGLGTAALSASEDFAASSHTHVSADITDSKSGGGTGDTGKLVEYDLDGGISTSGANAGIWTSGGGPIYTDAGGDIRTSGTFKISGGGFYTTLTGTQTANRAISFPNKSGTLATLDAETHTGAHAFSSTTRPTSAGTGTPASTSLITAADRRTEEVSDLSNVYYRQIMGYELGVWATVGASPSSVIDGNSRAGCRFIGTTGLSSASAQGGGIKYPDGGITGGPTFALNQAFDLRFLFRNSLSTTIFDVSFFASLRNNSNFWSASSIGLYHVPQPASGWAAANVYAVGARINVAGIVFVCSTSGTSGGSAPTWGTTINGTTNDNTVVWRHLGAHTSDKWALAFVDGSSVITLTDTGVAWVAGTSNTTALRLRSDGSSVFASVNGSAEVSVSRGALFSATPYIMCRGESATFARIAGLIWTVESANI